MYDQEANTQTAKKAADRSERKADAVGNSDGKRNIVHLRIGYGNQLYAWFVGKGSGQRRDLQDDFTRVFYSYRRHDWVPVWYQTHAE
jgi:hypothetical protein